MIRGSLAPTSSLDGEQQAQRQAAHPPKHTAAGVRTYDRIDFGRFPGAVPTKNNSCRWTPMSTQARASNTQTRG